MMAMQTGNKKKAVSEFCTRVYAIVRTIPRGRVATYGGVARALGSASARAVGQALRRNPFAPVVPCHRVITSSLGLGGFQGRRSGAATAQKRKLLAAEGVRFDDSGHLYNPEVVLFDCVSGSIRAASSP